MEETPKDSVEDSKEFIQWYVEMVEKFPSTFVHYLSQDALLHWFGRNIKGPESILYFIKSNMQGCKHIIKIPNSSNKPIKRLNNNVRTSPFNNDVNTTPESNVSTVYIEVKDEFAGGDGFHVDDLFLKRNSAVVSEASNCFKTSSILEFTKLYYKKDDIECIWQRPCILIIEYTGSLFNPLHFNIRSINYNDYMSCRRNLSEEFEKCASEID